MLRHIKEKNQTIKDGLIYVVVKILFFILIGLTFFYLLQNIFIPKRYPYIKSYDAGKLKYLYNEKSNDIDVLIFGTSHSSRALLPMELYESYGIKAYNLSTSAQPIEASYYLLKEAIKTQNPRVCVFDVSSLFFNSMNTKWWKFVMDEMVLSENKLLISKEYLKKCGDTAESMDSLLYPLLEYHTRWKELSKQDFDLGSYYKQYYGKGGAVTSAIYGGITSEEMNLITAELIEKTNRVLYEYKNGEFIEKNEQGVFYNSIMPEDNISWFLKLHNLCKENNIQLVAIKVPSIYMPQSYNSAWTQEKYFKVRSLCENNDILYYDLLYETDINLDTRKDSVDGGVHLNFYGAQKVSANLGNYLVAQFKLPKAYNDRWNRDLMLYKKVREVALLQLEQNFVTYLEILKNNCMNCHIFITVSDDMKQALNEEDINALQALGLRIDFANAFQNAYIAVIDNGIVKYEALSNQSMNYSDICQYSGKRYELYSSGWWTQSGSSIRLDGQEVGVNTKGINIVVYDDKLDLVLDSVAFDTASEYHMPIRNSGITDGFIEKIEKYYMDVTSK